MNLSESQPSNQRNRRNKIIILGFTSIVSILLFLIILFLFGIGHEKSFNFAPQWNLTWMIIELLQIVLGVYIGILLFHRALQRPNPIIKNVTLMLFTYIAAQIFVFIKKTNWFYLEDPIINDMTYFGMLLYNYRISLLFAAGATWFFFKFYTTVFQEENVSRIELLLVIVVTNIAMGAQLLIWRDQSAILNSIFSGIVLAQSLLITIPIIISSFKLVKRAINERKDHESSMREMFYGMLFLLLIGICYLGILISYIASIIWDATHSGFMGPFYKLQQILVYFMIIGCYLGFVFPKWFRTLVLSSPMNL